MSFGKGILMSKIEEHDDFTKRMVESYPSLFTYLVEGSYEPVSYFGVECRSGWYGIIEDLLEKLSKYPDVRICQIKEKFGGLRVYVDGGDDEVYRLIDEAESKAYNTCEVTGEPGKLRSDLGWIRTLCDEEYEKVRNRL